MPESLTGTERVAAGHSRPRLVVLGLVALGSGMAGLGYELAWTRLLGGLLGHEIVAVLGVVAAFFLGLALGGFVLDGPIRRVRRPWRVYMLLELAIGVWAVVTAWALPAVSDVLPRLVRPDAPGAALWAVAFAVPAVMLLPATMAMGGTLAALERLAAGVTGDRNRVAGIYGANTLGAVAGVALSVFVLMPALGLSWAVIALACVNGLCAAAAWWVGRDPATGLRRDAQVSASGVGGVRLVATLFLTGVLGIGFEVLVVRVASQVLENTVFTFASLLAVYLLGTAAGALAWQAVIRRRALPPATLGVLMALTSLICLGASALTGLLPAIVAAVRPAGLLAGEAMVAVAMFLLPAAAMGALFAHLAQSVRDRRGSVGQASGINALGAALAPAAMVFLVIPALGTQNGLVALSCCYLVLIPPRALRRAWPFAAVAVAGAVALSVWKPSPLIGLWPGGRLVASVEGPTALASVVEDANANRYLEIDGHFRMGGTSSLRSDWRQAQIPILLHPNPRSALFLGVGTGATLAGATRMPGLRATGVELAPEVVRLLPWFDDRNEHLGPRPELSIVTADARRFVRASSERHDLIVADLFHPALDGSGALYTREHFAAIRSRLAPGGLFCQWLPLHQLDLDSLRTIVRTFLDVFPEASAYLAHYSVQTPLLALIGPMRPAPLEPARLSARQQDPAAAGLFGRTGLREPIDLLGLYVGAAATLARFAGDGPLNTDDSPVVTFDARRNVEALRAPPAARLIALLDATTPDATSLIGAAGLDPARRERLDAYWRARDRFLAAGSHVAPEAGGLALVAAAEPDLLEVLRISGDFEPAYQPLLAMATTLLREDPAAGRRLLAAIAEAAPGRPEARRMLDLAGR